MAGSGPPGCSSVADKSQVQMCPGGYRFRKLDNAVEGSAIFVGWRFAPETPEFREHLFLHLAPVEVRVPIGINHPEHREPPVVVAG